MRDKGWSKSAQDVEAFLSSLIAAAFILALALFPER
jgi:hypothetical protein